ncbi:hypothetical protein ACSQ67_017486 [Phaseolus vulgaris]
MAILIVCQDWDEMKGYTSQAKPMHHSIALKKELLQRVLSYAQTYHFSYIPLAGPIGDANRLVNPLDAYRVSCYSLSRVCDLTFVHFLNELG